MTPFTRDLLVQRPTFGVPILHSHFDAALEQLREFGRFDSGGSILAITGPPQAGKSLLLGMLVEFLFLEVFRESPETSRPVVGASAQTSREGRTAPKFIYEMLLADCGNPLFDLEKLAQARYRPSTLLSETRMLTILTQAFRILGTAFVIIDEAQYMVRSKDNDFRTALLESLKSLVSGSRTLVLAGGYEFIELLLGHRAHLAARTTVLHLGRYHEEGDDVISWQRILRSFSELDSLALESDDVLLRHGDILLRECHGVIGILEHRIQKARMLAAAAKRPIDARILHACRPTSEQWETIRADIEMGESRLSQIEFDSHGSAPIVASAASKPERRRPASKRRTAAFERQPKRIMEGFETE